MSLISASPPPTTLFMHRTLTVWSCETKISTALVIASVPAAWTSPETDGFNGKTEASKRAGELKEQKMTAGSVLELLITNRLALSM